MILPDVNLLVYAYNEGAPHHSESKLWWEELCRRKEPIGLPWAVSCGFVRVMTHPRLLDTPMRPGIAMKHLLSWLSRSHVRILDPGPRHASILEQLFAATDVGGNLTTDTHLAAMAIEYQCEIHSNDTDFSRFPGLRWRNPLSSRRGGSTGMGGSS